MGLLLASALALLAAVPVASTAQSHDSLVRVLEGRGDFRVRVQAAFALGSTGDRRHRPALEKALRDQNPAVRAAAATALGRLGDPAATKALRKQRRDSNEAVRIQVARALQQLRESGGESETAVASRATATPTSPGAGGVGSGPAYPPIRVLPSEQRVNWRRVRYVVALGDMKNHTRFPGDELTSALRGAVAQQMRAIRGVAVFDGDLTDEALTQARRRNLPQLRLDGNIVKVDRKRQRGSYAVRCEVALMLSNAPGRVIRGEMRGAATGIEEVRGRRGMNREVEWRLASQALEGAVRSAMANASQALRLAAKQ